VAAGLARVTAVIDRIAADVNELARAPRAQDLDTAAVLPGPARGTPPAAGRAGPGVPGLLRPAAAARFTDPAAGAGLGRAWQAERYQRGEIGQRPADTGNPFRPR
jgi:hypothetical protein